MNDAAPYLAKAYVDERFAFQHTVLAALRRTGLAGSAA